MHIIDSYTHAAHTYLHFGGQQSGRRGIQEDQIGSDQIRPGREWIGLRIVEELTGEGERAALRWRNEWPEPEKTTEWFIQRRGQRET